MSSTCQAAAEGDPDKPILCERDEGLGSLGRFLPRVHYITDCGCGDLAQEALNLIGELSKFDVYGNYHEDSDSFVAFWLSINKCPSTGIDARCAHTDSRMYSLLKVLTRNGELNPPLLSSSLLKHADPLRVLKELSAHDDDDDDVEYGVSVIRYLTPAKPHATVVLSHYDASHPCPHTRDLSSLQNLKKTDRSLGAMIFGSLWPALVNHVHTLLDPVMDAYEPALPRPLQLCRGSYPTLELPQVEALRCLGNCDKVLVPSLFHRANFEASGLAADRLAILPTVVDLSFFTSDHAASTKDHKVVFLSIFSSSSRKNWKTSLEAYFSAFSRDDNVEYVLKVSSEKRGFNPKYTISMFSYGWAHEHGMEVDDLPRVKMISKSFDQRKRKGLFASADAFISTSHGESFALVAFEAMAMGLPVIAPNWGLFR
ncbi:MAG: glycosyltransferase family 4 protein, partial [archaeon]|nr:glycosyltransferase family 4 protein [archaeon]